MATYAISDIHGNLKALQALLVDINFRYDGSDRLILLGDYVDWGPASIATLEFVMRLDCFPFVTCLMGNHDLMFLDEIERTRKHSRLRDNNWLYNNRGIDTWKQFEACSEEEKDYIYKWLKKRPYSAEVYVGRKWYLLAHAGAYLPEKRGTNTPGEIQKKQLYAVWHRIETVNERPLLGLYGRYPNHSWKERKYAGFLCGHTISSRYTDTGLYEQNTVYEGQYFTNIDCGAKCMGLAPDGDYYLERSIINGRLAAYRIDDGQAFYCDRIRAGYYADMTEIIKEENDYIDN